MSLKFLQKVARRSLPDSSPPFALCRAHRGYGQLIELARLLLSVSMHAYVKSRTKIQIDDYGAD